jgi:predicted amidohydrolase
MTSTADVEANLTRAERLVDDAAGQGARLVALPENFAFLRHENVAPAYSTTLDGAPVTRLARLARRRRCHVLLGSIPEAIPGSKRIHNTSVLLGPRGDVVAVYRKVHLFDIAIRGRVELSESKHVVAGDRPVVARTPLGALGLSICYDLRFPELYRWLAFAGAEVLFVPAAFTAFTGPHHWLPLLRARAIENQCWVVAPAQVGRHNPDRRSHGEAVIIDPWGAVVARKPRGQGWISAEIDLARVASVRRGLPCLEHARPRLFGAPPDSSVASTTRGRRGAPRRG